MMKTIAFLTLVAAFATAAHAGVARQSGSCGLGGTWRILSGRIDFDSGGGASEPVGSRTLVLTQNHWRFGSSSGSGAVARISAADWRRWHVQPYGPVYKIILNGFAGSGADGPIETEGSAVDFFWLIYHTAAPDPGTVSFKFGKLNPDPSCAVKVATPRTGARLQLSPARVSAGNPVHAKASGFIPGEELKLTDTYQLNGSPQTSPLTGGSSDTRGALSFDRTTIAGITKPGAHRLCVTGLRSRLVACAVYTVLGPGHIPTGPGFTPAKAGGDYQAPKSDNGFTPPKSDNSFTPPKAG